MLQAISCRQSKRGIARLICRALAVVREKLRPALRPDSEKSAGGESTFVERQVEKRIYLLRHEMFSTFVAWCSLCMCVAHVWRSLREAANMERWSSQGVDVMLAIFTAILNLLNAFPALMTNASVPLWGHSLAFCLTASTSHFVCPQHLVPAVDAWILIPRMLLCVTVLSQKFTFFWFFLHLVAVHLNSGEEWTGVNLVATAFYHMVVAIACTSFVQSYTKESHGRDIRSIISQSELKAASSLMNLTCDAVVELDTDLKVLKGANQLAVILFLASPSSAQGKELKQFCCSEADQEAFLRAMGRVSHEADASTQVFHLPLRDSQGNKISMEFFHVCFSHLGEVRHLLGVRELSDPAPADQYPVGRLSDDGQALLPLSTADAPPGQRGITAVRFHAVSFRVQDCSDGFREEFGEPPHNVTDWMAISKNADFEVSYKKSFHEFIKRGDFESDTAATCTVCLNLPRTGMRPKRRCQAVCALTFHSTASDKYLDFPGDVIATMEILRHSTRGSHGHGSGGSLTSSGSGSRQRAWQDAAEAAELRNPPLQEAAGSPQRGAACAPHGGPAIFWAGAHDVRSGAASSTSRGSSDASTEERGIAGPVQRVAQGLTRLAI